MLVHCFAGRSRSASCVIAYIMKQWQTTYDIVFDYVDERRDEICPNSGFIQQLLKWEKYTKKKDLWDRDITTLPGYIEPLFGHDDSYTSSEEIDFTPSPKNSPKKVSIVKTEPLITKKPLNSYQKAMLKKKTLKR